MLLLHLLFTTTALALAIPSTTAPSQTLIARDATTLLPSSTPAPDGTFLTTEHIILDGVTNAHVTIPAKTVNIVRPTCIQTLTPDKNGHLPPGTCNAIWNYYPSFNAAVVFAVLFALVTGVHVWQAVRYKKVRMSFLLYNAIMGCLLTVLV
jgi:hypothetical protein